MKFDPGAGFASHLEVKGSAAPAKIMAVLVILESRKSSALTIPVELVSC
jgi:hypothetical protein